MADIESMTPHATRRVPPVLRPPSCGPWGPVLRPLLPVVMRPAKTGTLDGVTDDAAGPINNQLVRAIRDFLYRNFAREIIKRHVAHPRYRYEDRRVLEQIIIPFILSRFEPQTVLDIGREPYEAFYNEFYVGRELWTIDWDAARTPFGSPNHIVDDVANVRDHLRECYFDFVLMNGVFGWGLNQKESIEKALAAVRAILRPGGIFVLGWNDTPDLVPVPLTQVQALKELTPYHFEPLGGTSFKCSSGEHTYSFYTR
jgi:SAM-dependent methyltransferase